MPCRQNRIRQLRRIWPNPRSGQRWPGDQGVGASQRAKRRQRLDSQRGARRDCRFAIGWRLRFPHAEKYDGRDDDRFARRWLPVRRDPFQGSWATIAHARLTLQVLPALPRRRNVPRRKHLFPRSCRVHRNRGCNLRSRLGRKRSSAHTAVLPALRHDLGHATRVEFSRAGGAVAHRSGPTGSVSMGLDPTCAYSIRSRH